MKTHQDQLENEEASHPKEYYFFKLPSFPSLVYMTDSNQLDPLRVKIVVETSDTPVCLSFSIHIDKTSSIANFKQNVVHEIDCRSSLIGDSPKNKYLWLIGYNNRHIGFLEQSFDDLMHGRLFDSTSGI
jgi:hypothetical protein